MAAVVAAEAVAAAVAASNKIKIVVLVQVNMKIMRTNRRSSSSYGEVVAMVLYNDSGTTPSLPWSTDWQC